MGILARIASFFSNIFGKKKVPVHENCSFCGQREYLPFHCEYCGRYFCGKHRLPCEHDCKNIRDWKRSSSEGATVESKAGNLFVRK